MSANKLGSRPVTDFQEARNKSVTSKPFFLRHRDRKKNYPKEKLLKKANSQVVGLTSTCSAILTECNK